MPKLTEYDFLINTPLFSGIRADSLPVILEKLDAHAKHYKKDEYIKLTGDKADFIGIVLSGSIQILLVDYYGKRSINATLSHGELFAEAFACAGVTSLPVDIVSSSDSEILFISSAHLLSSPKDADPSYLLLLNNLLRIVSQKNMQLNRKLQYISHKTTSEKIMAYLNGQAMVHNSNEFTIPFDRQELADFLGVERSAMSAEISKLVKSGVIETRRSHFKLC